MTGGGLPGIGGLRGLPGIGVLQAAGGRTESDNLTLLLAVVVFVVVLAVVLTLVREVPRRRRLRADQRWAAERGWRVLGGDRALAQRLLGVFGLGASCRVSRLIAGSYAGRPGAAFEYWEGTSDAEVQVHMVTLRLPVPLPALRLSPQALTDEMAAAVGGQDIVFESDDFNRAWRVRAADAKFAHDVVHPRLMERLLAADAEGISIWIVDGDLLCWVPGKADLESVDGRLAVLAAFIDSIPRFVWLDHGYDPGPDLTAAVPVPEQGLPTRSGDRPVVSAAARATDRHWGRMIVSWLTILVLAGLAVVLAVAGLRELAQLVGVLAFAYAGLEVVRLLIGRSLRRSGPGRV